jgi:transposase
MLKLTEETRIYVADQPVDCRKAINGLASLVVEQFEMPVNDGSVYVFYNGSRDRVKCLFWDKNGFVLYHKRLEQGHFKMSKTNNGAYVISQNQLDWLLAGLDFSHYF